MAITWLFGWHAEELDGDFVQNGRLVGARIPDVSISLDEVGVRGRSMKRIKRINQVAMIWWRSYL